MLDKKDKHQNSIIILKNLLLLCRIVLFLGIEPFFLARSFPVFMMNILIKKIQDNYFMSQQDK